MKREWIDIATSLCSEPADFYEGGRKILRGRRVTFNDTRWDIQLEDAGYTKSKLSLLRGHYLHEESRAVAVELWDHRLGKGKYGSVSFTAFNHFVKGGSVDAKRSRISSVFGPCIQSVSITLMPQGEVAVDVFYRTTEFFKKFPADVIFLRELIEPFNLDLTLASVTFHFANVTLHPMYFVTLLGNSKKPIALMDSVKKGDHYMWKWCVKWTSRYLDPADYKSIAKYEQAKRVKLFADERIQGVARRRLLKYIRGAKEEIQ